MHNSIDTRPPAEIAKIAPFASKSGSRKNNVPVK
jgi:hypothetical protein